MEFQRYILNSTHNSLPMLTIFEKSVLHPIWKRKFTSQSSKINTKYTGDGCSWNRTMVLINSYCNPLESHGLLNITPVIVTVKSVFTMYAMFLFCCCTLIRMRLCWIEIIRAGSRGHATRNHCCNFLVPHATVNRSLQRHVKTGTGSVAPGKSSGAQQKKITR